MNRVFGLRRVRVRKGEGLTHTNAVTDLQQDVSLRGRPLVKTTASNEHSCGSRHRVRCFLNRMLNNVMMNRRSWVVLTSQHYSHAGSTPPACLVLTQTCISGLSVIKSQFGFVLSCLSGMNPIMIRGDRDGGRDNKLSGWLQAKGNPDYKKHSLNGQSSARFKPPQVASAQR